MEVPPTVSLPSDVNPASSTYQFRFDLAEVLQKILRYNNRYFSGEHLLSEAIPHLHAQRVSEVASDIEQIADLLHGLTINGARVSFC